MEQYNLTQNYMIMLTQNIGFDSNSFDVQLYDRQSY